METLQVPIHTVDTDLNLWSTFLYWHLYIVLAISNVVNVWIHAEESSIYFLYVLYIDAVLV